MSGFKTKGQHISDLGFRVVSRNAPPPEDMEVRESIFGVHGDYDFSMIFGEPIKENRLITYVVKTRESEREKFRLLKTKLENWLLDGQIVPIYDDYEPNYYYLGKCTSVDLNADDYRGIATYSITFDCYPFKINALPEGHDIWDDFNFELDVAQETEFDLDVSWNSFKELNIGDAATYGAWATQYLGGTPINMQMLGQTYRIIDKRYQNQSRSRIAYKLSGIDEWLLEQDIIQAQTEFLDFLLINNGASSVAPTITATSKVTLVKDNKIYNLMTGTYKDDLFRLDIGENKIKAYTANVSSKLSFDFHKELI